MKLFLDTAELSQIEEAISWGIIDGVTTNPSLIRKAVLELKSAGEDLDMEDYIKKILSISGKNHSVSLEVAGLTFEDMYRQGRILFEMFNSVAGNVVIKIPVSPVNTNGEGDPFDSIRVIKKLSSEHIPVNATLIFTPEQALLAARAGADYVSPFAGRIDDRIRRAAGLEFDKDDYFPAGGLWEEDGEITVSGLLSGVDLVAQIVDMFRVHEIGALVIAASIRNPIQARECAVAGSDIATIPMDVLKSMILHPGTLEGIDTFTNDLVEEYTGLLIPQEENAPQ